ncbi:MAG: creatininase family protein [Streptosporangiaceae bacterium]
MTGRVYGRLAAPDIDQRLGANSILCLPIGSYEQHGPHLPLQTDTVIAECFTDRLLVRYGGEFDLWALPAIPYGLSLEHAWSAGTISLTTQLLVQLLDAIVGEYVRATPARNVLVVNGHGGNRGVLEAALYELQRAHGVHICVVHPSTLSKAKFDASLPEIHAGMRETSVMLALAPDDVHLDRIPAGYAEDIAQRDPIRRYVLERGTTWPWTSHDPSLSAIGIMGSDPRTATRELGEMVIESALDQCRDVLSALTKQG